MTAHSHRRTSMQFCGQSIKSRNKMAIVHQLVSFDDKEIDVVEVEVLVKIDGVAGDASCCAHLISGQCNGTSTYVNKTSHHLNYQDIKLKYHIDPLILSKGTSR